MGKLKFTIFLLQFVFLTSTIQAGGDKVLTLTAYIEGFYNQITYTMLGDTVQVYLRNDDSPYQLIDSAKVYLDTSGVGIISFSNITNDYDFRIVVKHRNSIETWSNETKFHNDTLSYNFSTSASQAYGNNLKLRGQKFCIYGGDVDQDGTVGLTDNSLIDNDAYSFVTGYRPTDLNGDRVVDIIDIAIAGNNASNFVSVKRPPYENINWPVVTVANVTIDSIAMPWITCFDFLDLPVGAVLECDFISTDPDFGDRLWDTAYWSMRDFWLPFEINATIVYTPPIEHVGPSPLLTHMYLVFHEPFIGYVKWGSYDRVHHEERCVLFFNY